MSKAFPTNKDRIIDDMEEQHNLHLSEEEYDRLRVLSESKLLLVAVLLSRATTHERFKLPGDDS